MITGDHPLTAVAIAKKLHLTTDDIFLTGQDLQQMSVEERLARIPEISVFARVSPEHKMIIINVLQSHHQIVAMTGDGVNDAPALKSADIGVCAAGAGIIIAISELKKLFLRRKSV